MQSDNTSAAGNVPAADGLLRFAFGESRKTHKVKNVELLWSEFIKKFEVAAVVRTDETMDEYLRRSNEAQADLKDVGHYTPGAYRDGIRRKENISFRGLITMDVDHAPNDFLARLLDKESGLGQYEFIVHTTRKDREGAHKYRVIFAAQRDMDAIEYGAVSRAIADCIPTGSEKASIEWFDETGFEFTRVNFWPSVSRDQVQQYRVIHNPGEWINPDEWLALYTDYTNIESWPMSAKMFGKLHAERKKAGNPCEKPGIIGAWCRTYDPHQAIDKFLSDHFKPGSTPNRYTYALSHGFDGAVIYPDGHMYSRHETDPGYYQNLNSFDLVRVHLFRDLDKEEHADLPIHQKPSHIRMREFALEDPEVFAEYVATRQAESSSEFDDFDAEPAVPEPVGPETTKPPPTNLSAGVSVEVLAEMEAASNDMLFLPNDYLPPGLAARRIYERIGEARELFRRAHLVVELDAAGRISPVTSTAFRSRLQRKGRQVRAFKVSKHGQIFSAQKICSEDTAKLLLQTLEVQALPEIVLVSCAPCLIEHAGQLVTTRPGYNAIGGGILVKGALSVREVPVREAADSLEALLDDFNFATAGDKSRALVSLIAPGLRMGGLVPGNALITAVEADHSQTGKGFLLKVIREIYGESAYLVGQRNGGVGSLDESIGSALISGAPFVLLDNMRGQLNSTYLEMLITAGSDSVAVRVPHRGEVEVNIERVSLQLTSNGVAGTIDLANRLLLIRLRKQREGYRFSKFAEGDLLQHVRMQQSYYLGCVHSLIREWWAAGKPALHTDHSFRQWVGVLDWFAREIWGSAPLLEGHAAATERIANPGLSWLRQIAHAVIRQGKAAVKFSASQLFELGVSLELLPQGTRADLASNAGALSVGIVLGRCFAEREVIEIEGIRVQRAEYSEWDPTYRMERDKKSYTFSRIETL